MSVPSPLLMSHGSADVRGDVTVHPEAAIASGVVLYAEADSRIVIEAGVCIGSGVILHAVGGTLVLAAGVNLGSGVLIFGKGLIGSNACIGSASTVLDPAIAAAEVVPPQSLLGDPSRLAGEPVEVETLETPKVPVPALPEPTPDAPPEEQNNAPLADSEPPISLPTENPPTIEEASPPTPVATAPAVESAVESTQVSAPGSLSQPVTGHKQLQQLLTKMFPYGHTLNRPP